MDHIIEIVLQNGSGELGGSVARRIIGETASIKDARDMLAAESGGAAEAVLVRRADVELDDDALACMLDAMGAIDRNAIVVPRYSLEDTSLERASVPFDARVPVPDGACSLLAMDVYRRFGPFDERIEGVAEALVAYGARVNDAGYSTVVAENAVANVGELHPASNDLNVLDKHAYLPSFLEFADTASLRKPKLLFDFHDMPPFYCGTSEYQMALIRYFKECFSGDYDVTIRCNEEAVRFHGIREFGFKVLLPDETAGLFDIGLVATQPVSLEKQFFLNRHCLRFAYTMLDCIWLRSNYLCMEGPDVEDVARCGLRNCDGVIAISDFSRRDCLDYFSSDPVVQSKETQVVYISTDFGQGELAEIRAKIPFDHYDLVIGNTFKHKALERVLEAVAGTETNYVFVGLPKDVELPSNVVAFPHATLEEPFLDALYEHCDCVVFPSQYEGFGLPITIAFRHGKKAIVCDNELNRELAAHFSGLEGNLLFFSSFDEIPGLSIQACEGAPFCGELTDTWRGAVLEVEAFLRRILAKPVDWFRLDGRQWQYRLLEEEMDVASQRTEDWMGFKYLIWKRLIKGRPMLDRMYRKAMWGGDPEMMKKTERS